MTDPDPKPHYLVYSGRNVQKTHTGYRQTHFIRDRVTQSIFRAFDYAPVAGMPMNIYAVINLASEASIPPTKIFAGIRRKFTNWLRYAGHTRGEKYPSAYTYTHENPSGDNPHVNWTLHVPEPLIDEFYQKLPVWVEKCQGFCRHSDFTIDPIHQPTAKRLANYVVKGTDPVHIDRFYLQNVANDEGIVFGKRAGVSPALGRVAREEANFKPRRRRFQAR